MPNPLLYQDEDEILFPNEQQSDDNFELAGIPSAADSVNYSPDDPGAPGDTATGLPPLNAAPPSLERNKPQSLQDILNMGSTDDPGAPGAVLQPPPAAPKSQSLADILRLGPEDDASPEDQPATAPGAPQPADSPNDAREPGAQDLYDKFDDIHNADGVTGSGGIAAAPVKSPTQNLRDVIARGPEVYNRKNPSWLQRIGAGAIGAAAGWNNANPKARPIDASQTMEKILYPGQDRREQQYEKELELAKLGVDQETQGINNAAKVGDIKAQTQERTNQAAFYAAEARKQATINPDLAGKRTAFVKMLGKQTPVYQNDTLSVPDGYVALRDPDVAGQVALVRGGLQVAPKELIDGGYLLGVKPGDKVPLDELQTATEKYYTGKLEQQKENAKSKHLGVRWERNDKGDLTGIFYDPLTGSVSHQEVVKGVGQTKPAPAQNNIYTPAPQPLDAAGKPRAATLDDVPANIRPQVELALTYGTRLPPASRNNPINQQIRDWVAKVDPSYQESNFDTYKSTERDATTGKIATTSDAIGVMMSHLSTLDEASDALKGSNIQALNRIANAVGAQIGQSPITTYETIVHRLSPEITKAYVAGGGSASERGANESDFDPKLGPDQIKNNIRMSAQLADGKIAENQAQYERGTFGRGKQKLLSPQAEAARQRLLSGSPPATGPAMGGYLVGRKYGNLTYQGGDPNNKASWK